MLTSVIYWVLKAYFSLFFILYLLSRLGGSDPGILWDITGILSLLFFIVNALWMVKR